MADEPNWRDIFSTEPTPEDETGANPADSAPAAPASRREAREQAAFEHARRPGSRRNSSTMAHGLPRRKPRRSLTWLWVLLAFVVVLGGVTTAVWINFGPQIRQVFAAAEPTDYTGAGAGSIVINITNGQIGSDVATTLATSGVTKTYKAFYSLLLTQSPEVTFTPGSYKLKLKMSASAALAALEDPANKVSTRISLPEGITVRQVVSKLANLSDSTGVTEEQLNAAVADFRSYGLPTEAPNIEGYLFPATYTLQPKMTARDIIKTFVDRMFASLDAAGVAPADRHRVLTLAALTQKEGGNNADFLKVARVWDNRIAVGMDLQSDATVSYGVGGTTLSTTVAERADKSNPYNTYANPGLPIGPISNPGDAAIEATLHPADGTWLYFVVVNCATKETAFSNTFAEHQAANAQLGAWAKANPGGCK